MPEAQVKSWSEPQGILGELVARAHQRARELQPSRSELHRMAAEATAPASFAASLRAPDVALICEIKRRSPSRGAIAEDLDVAARTRSYAEGGAAALSILTEPRSFGGSEADLTEARRAVALPLLRKDFLVDPLQLVESRALGASAVLLIARAMPSHRLLELAALASELGLDALVEVRTEQELAIALETGATVIGVNTRNLETLEIDSAVAELLLPLIPADRVGVYESGVRTREDVVRAAASGADAVLVGSSLSASDDPKRAVAALAGVPAPGRGNGA